MRKADRRLGADYGLTVIRGAGEGAARFALFVLSTEGQGILAANGFAASNLP